MSRIASLSCLATLLLCLSTWGQETVQDKKAVAEVLPTSKEITETVRAACRELLRRQESYHPDKAVGQIKKGNLSAWLEGERARLEKLFQEKERTEWPYEGVYRVGRDLHIPAGYRVGGTSISALAIMANPDFGQDQKAEAAVLNALLFVLDQVETNKEIDAGPQQGYDVRSWAHCYGLNFLVEARARGFVKDQDVEKRVDAGIKSLLNCLYVNQAPGGGWNYTGGPSSSFMTGAVLLVLYRAEDLGHKVKPGLIKSALKALIESRRSNRAFAYAGKARSPVAIEASSARSACAELALYLAGKTDVEGLRAAIENFFSSFEELLKRKSQQGTHEGPYNIAPYYFYFGHLFAARAIEALPDAERPALRQRLLAKIWSTRDADGFWNDRIFPRSKSYATAMIVLALQAESLGLPRTRN